MKNTQASLANSTVLLNIWNTLQLQTRWNVSHAKMFCSSHVKKMFYAPEWLQDHKLNSCCVHIRLLFLALCTTSARPHYQSTDSRHPYIQINLAAIQSWRRALTYKRNIKPRLTKLFSSMAPFWNNKPNNAHFKTISHKYNSLQSQKPIREYEGKNPKRAGRHENVLNRKTTTRSEIAKYFAEAAK